MTVSAASGGQVSGRERVGVTNWRCWQVLSTVSGVAGSGRGPVCGTSAACAEGREENHEKPQSVALLKQKRCILDRGIE